MSEGYGYGTPSATPGTTPGATPSAPAASPSTHATTVGTPTPLPMLPRTDSPDAAHMAAFIITGVALGVIGGLLLRWFRAR